MNKMNQTSTRVMVMAAILSLVLFSVGFAAAQGPGKGMGHGKGTCNSVGKGDQCRCGAGDGPGFGLERLAARLDLTDEQQKEIRSIKESIGEKGITLRKEMMQLRNEMQGEMLKDDPSEKKILSLNEKIGAIRTQMKANHLKTRLAVREQLTPDQRDKMLMFKERSRRGGDGFDGRQGRKMGRRGEGRQRGKGHPRHQCSGRSHQDDCPENNQ